MVPKPRRLVGEKAEGRGVRLRKPEAGEGDELVVDGVRELLLDAFLERAGHEARAVRLERGVGALAAHRAAQALRLADREARKMDRDVEHLVLEDDHAECLAQRLLEERMVDGRLVGRVVAQLPPVLDVRVHGLALDRPGTDERDLDRDVVEVLGTCAQDRLHLRAALDLEAADRVGPLDLLEDVSVVERHA